MLHDPDGGPESQLVVGAAGPLEGGQRPHLVIGHAGHQKAGRQLERHPLGIDDEIAGDPHRHDPPSPLDEAVPPFGIELCAQLDDHVEGIHRVIEADDVRFLLGEKGRRLGGIARTGGHDTTPLDERRLPQRLQQKERILEDAVLPDRLVLVPQEQGDAHAQALRTLGPRRVDDAFILLTPTSGHCPSSSG